MARPTAEELEDMGLTPEEIEGYLSDEEEVEGGENEDADNDGAATNEDEKARGDDAGDDDAGEDGEADGGADASGDDDGDHGNEAEGDDTADTAKAARVEAPVPLLSADVPEDADEQLAAVAEAKEKLAERFDDGELTPKEYQAELDKLMRQERDIELKLFKANIAQEMAERAAQESWRSTVRSFLDEHPFYKQNELAYRTLDMVVRDIAKQPENQGLSGAEILARAHERIAEGFGLKEQPQPQKPQGKETRQQLNLPPTLGKVPAADMTEAGNTRWARLDRLADTDPDRYEAELAKLSPEEQEAYLQTV